MSGIGLLILAAGASTRLGQPKQLLPYRGTTLIRHIAEVAILTGCQPVAIVLGACAETIEPHLADLTVQIIHNERWSTGMASSIHCGLKQMQLTTPNLEAIVLMVCDQPFVTSHLLQRLVSGYQTSQSPIVASEYAHTLGVPALFDKSLFSELDALQGDMGAKSIIRQHRSWALGIPFAEGAIDLDTPESLDILSS